MRALIHVSNGAPSEAPTAAGLINIDSTNNKVYISRPAGDGFIWGEPLDGNASASMPVVSVTTESVADYEYVASLDDPEYWGKHIVVNVNNMSSMSDYQYLSLDWLDDGNDSMRDKQFRVTNNSNFELFIRRDGDAEIITDSLGGDITALRIPAHGVIWGAYEKKQDDSYRIRIWGNYDKTPIG